MGASEEGNLKTLTLQQTGGLQGMGTRIFMFTVAPKLKSEFPLVGA